jgi:hypothetical protein
VKRNNKKRDEAQADAPVMPVVVYTVDEAARALRISPWSMRRLIEIGAVPRLNIACVSHRARRRDRDARMRRVLVSAADVAAFIERCREIR